MVVVFLKCDRNADGLNGRELHRNTELAANAYANATRAVLRQPKPGESILPVFYFFERRR